MKIHQFLVSLFIILSSSMTLPAAEENLIDSLPQKEKSFSHQIFSTSNLSLKNFTSPPVRLGIEGLTFFSHFLSPVDQDLFLLSTGLNCLNICQNLIHTYSSVELPTQRFLIIGLKICSVMAFFDLFNNNRDTAPEAIGLSVIANSLEIINALNERYQRSTFDFFEKLMYEIHPNLAEN